MDIKISVIVPVFNTEKYLERCLESIINQSLKAIEIIVVNDGSTDNSYKIIEKFAEQDSRIIIINHKNGGLAKARNSGLKAAKGKYIMHVDSDDWIENEGFLTMYNKAEEEGLDIVLTDAYWDYDNGTIVYVKEVDISEKEIITGEDYIQKFLRGQAITAVLNKLFKRQLYIENNLLHPEGISFGEDIVMTLKLSYYAKKIGKLNKSYVHYIQHIDSMSRKSPVKLVYDLLKSFQILEDFFKTQSKNYDINFFKMRELSTYLINCKYNVNDPFYQKAIEEYIKANKSYSKYASSKKIYLYSILLKIFSSKKIFKAIYIFEKTFKKLIKYQ